MSDPSRFTVSVGIDPSLTKRRHTRSISMDKRALISPLWEIVYYSDTCIVYLAVREAEYFTLFYRPCLLRWPGPMSELSKVYSYNICC